MKRSFLIITLVSAILISCQIRKNLDTTKNATEVSSVEGYRDNYVKMISAGASHTCALTADGVVCWGSDEDGRITVPDLKQPIQIAAGEYHTCALASDKVKCWGSNSSHQLDVPVLNHPVAIAAGALHTCAITSDGVKCWGDNSNGQFDVPSLSLPTAIAAGNDNTCATTSEGVKCWGGNNSLYRHYDFVNLRTPPAAITVGHGNRVCALTSDGVGCWCFFRTTNLGDRWFWVENTPKLNHPTAIESKFDHDCAITNDGVRCWSHRWEGYELGDAPYLDHPSAITTGLYHVCAITKDGVVCWGGYNGDHQLDVPDHLKRNPL